MVETETASFWYESPEVKRGELKTEEIPTEVFLLPAAGHAEKDGTFTNTQRLLQWREKAVDPPGDSRSENWFMFHLGVLLKEKARRDPRPRNAGLLALTWNYPTEGKHQEPVAEEVLKEINGCTIADRRIGAWIHRAQSRRFHGVRLLDLFRRISRSPARTVRISAPPGIFTDTVGVLRGHPTAEFSTIAPPLVPMESPGASAKNSSGGMKRRRNGRATTSPILSRPSLPTINLRKMQSVTMLSRETSPSSCMRMALAGFGSQSD